MGARTTSEAPLFAPMRTPRRPRRRPRSTSKLARHLPVGVPAAGGGRATGCSTKEKVFLALALLAVAAVIGFVMYPSIADQVAGATAGAPKGMDGIPAGDDSAAAAHGLGTAPLFDGYDEATAGDGTPSGETQEEAKAEMEELDEEAAEEEQTEQEEEEQGEQEEEKEEAAAEGGASTEGQGAATDSDATHGDDSASDRDEYDGSASGSEDGGGAQDTNDVAKGSEDGGGATVPVTEATALQGAKDAAALLPAVAASTGALAKDEIELTEKEASGASPLRRLCVVMRRRRAPASERRVPLTPPSCWRRCARSPHTRPLNPAYSNSNDAG